MTENVLSNIHYRNITSRSSIISKISGVTTTTSINVEGINSVLSLGKDLSTKHVLFDMRLLFQDAKYEEFEFGRQSNFVKSLNDNVEREGIKAILCIASVCLSNQAEPEVINQALQWLGGLNDAATFILRLNTLEQCLFFSSRWVRDGASLGLEQLGSKQAIPFLKRAIEQETIVELRDDMTIVLRELEQSIQ